MTNKNTQQNQEVVNPLVGEKMGPELLLRGWNMALETVNQAVQHNVRSRVRWPERFTSIFFDHMVPMDIKKKQNWLAACINVKTNTPHTLDSLINANVLSESERDLFGLLPLPRRELTNLYRVQLPNDKSEKLMRWERWFGLNKSAGIVTISVLDLDYTRRIEVTRYHVDKDPENRGGEQVLINEVGENNQWLTAEKIYLTPFNSNTVQQALLNAGPPSEKSSFGRIGLGLIREGSPNPVGLTTEDNNVETWSTKSFDELFDKSLNKTSTNVTNINVDPKDLADFLKYQKEHKQDPQYG